jgi:hypothetical protein
MTDRYLEFEDIQDRLGISFGLAIDIEALYECFQIYSAGGGQDSDDGKSYFPTADDRLPMGNRSIE